MYSMLNVSTWATFRGVCTSVVSFFPRSWYREQPLWTEDVGDGRFRGQSDECIHGRIEKMVDSDGRHQRVWCPAFQFPQLKLSH